MVKSMWINLPVADVSRSKRFFTEIGFALHPQHADDEGMAAIVVAEGSSMVMLFPQEVFAGFASTHVSNTRDSSEVLLSFEVDSREEVDRVASRVTTAGGAVFSGPGEQGGLYGAGFTDPDGHRWNLLYMGANAS